MKYPIVVGTDLTHASNDAVVEAEARATRDAMPLTIVHAMSPLLWGMTADVDARAHIVRVIQEQMLALTGRAETSYEVMVERGLPHSVLARVAISERALLVVGGHMHHGIGHALLRDVSERVVERARGPVLITRPGPRSARVLVALDRPFQESSALGVAAEEARASDSVLTVLHCIDNGFLTPLTTDMLDGGTDAGRPLSEGSQVNEVRQALKAELRRRRVDAQLLVLEGEPTSLIPAIAERQNTELVIVGTTHHAQMTHQVTTAVLRHTACSVLVVDEASAHETTQVFMQVHSS